MTPAQNVLEEAGGSFVAGYNCALTTDTVGVLVQLSRRPVRLRGFFAEGAAMGAALASLVQPSRDRLSPLLIALDERYAHLAHVGVGWAIARLPIAGGWLSRKLDPLLAQLTIDGRGFHDGFFRTTAIMHGWRALSGARGEVYDQGVGRSLWFACGADAGRIISAIRALADSRRSDLWAGLGLASVYAGGAGAADIERLLAACDGHRQWLRQGAAFGVVAHRRAGLVPGHAVEAAEQITGWGVPELVAMATVAEQAARRATLSPLAAYRHWRSGIAETLGDVL